MNCDHNVDLIPEAAEIASPREGVCPVDWAKKCVHLARESNCGKSVMCRDGMTQLAAIMDDFTRGRGEDGDIELIRDLCTVISTTEGCELAVKAAENVLFSLDNYAEDWDAHRRKKCPALVCPAYYSVYIDPETCTGCGKCLRAGVEGGDGLIHVVTDDSELKSEEFFALCPVGAIKRAGAVKPQLPASPVPVGSFAQAGGRRRRRGGAAEEAPAPAPAPVPASAEKDEYEEKEHGRVFAVRMNYQAGYGEYKKWPCEGLTIHAGTGWFHPFGQSSYVAIAGPCKEAEEFPAEKYFTEEWQRMYDNRLFCIYRLADGDIYAWDGIYCCRAEDENLCVSHKSSFHRRDILTNIIVGGTGRYKGASGIMTGTAEGSGDTKDVGNEIVLPQNLIKCLTGYIKLPE